MSRDPVSLSLLGNPPFIRRKETAQFFGLVRQGSENVALPVTPVAHFVGLFGFFLLIMITLWAKTINAC